MEEAQALLLENFRVGKGNPSACAQWLTEMARNLLAPIPFREVFVILALFLPHFFHECGRRVGMVPRSSLKEGKNSLMVEKRTRTTNTTQKPNKTQPTGRVSTIM